MNEKIKNKKIGSNLVVPIEEREVESDYAVFLFVEFVFLSLEGLCFSL